MKPPSIATTESFVRFLISLKASDPLLADVIAAHGDQDAILAALEAAGRDGDVLVWDSSGYPPQVLLTPLGAFRAGVVLTDDSAFWMDARKARFKNRPTGEQFNDGKGSIYDSDGEELIPDVGSIVDPASSGDPTDLILGTPDVQRFVNGVPIPRFVKFVNHNRTWLPADVAVGVLDARDRTAPACSCSGKHLDFNEICLVCCRGGMDHLLPPPEDASVPVAHRVYAPDAAKVEDSQ